MKKLLTYLVLSTILITNLGTQAFAYQLTKRSDLSFDETLADQTGINLAQPGKIIISRVITPFENYTKDSQTWIKSLYYYSITRLGFLDLPFTYLVDREGNIYEGRQGGEYTDPETADNSGAIVIGYLSNYDDITTFALTAFRQIITEASYKYGITYSNISVDTLKTVKDTQGVAGTVFSQDQSAFGTQLIGILKTFKYYNSEHINYIAEIKELKYPATVKSTEIFNVSFKLVNKNDFPWFTNLSPIYITSKKDSPFFINDKWESFSKPILIENKVVMPNEELDISFDMNAMVLPGKYTQKFSAIKLPNIEFENSTIPLKFTVTKGDKKLVKIVNISRLNVRACPGPKCEVLTQVGEDQFFVMLEYSAGWYKIKYSDNKSGWVYGQYVQPL